MDNEASAQHSWEIKHKGLQTLFISQVVINVVTALLLCICFEKVANNGKDTNKNSTLNMQVDI